MSSVALRKESVDRKIDQMKARGYGVESLSARRAWIEKQLGDKIPQPVVGRSPQGERG